MLLLPIAHEHQTVQRLPWITFSLIAICVVVYIFTGILGGGDEAKLEEKLQRFFDYFSQRPYLELPPEMDMFLTSADHETLAMLRESVDRTTLDPDEVQEEQQELNRMAAEISDELNSDPLRQYGYIPSDPHFLNLISCLFLHAGFWHLFGNMLFLFLAGCALEDLWGRPLYLGFYLLSGFAATLTHDLQFSDSSVAIIGASGAIAGIMGAFLIRLARTRIKFFYFFWLFLYIRTGTFEAPAFIMLPLWFMQQVLYASLTDESAGVAFWAHIGGFAFGALFGLGMNALRVEERYIAPKIEKKVSLVQNPLFLQAIDLSEKGDHPQALVLLQRVVKQEPNHLDALMEMRNIYEISADADGFTRTVGSILDSVLRSKDPEMVLTNLDYFRASPLKKTLPARTLLGLAGFFEENQDDTGASFLYEELVQNYGSDPLAMKASSKLARLYLEKLNDRERGEAAFWMAYEHPLANEEWRAVLRQDMKRYQIDPDSPHAEPVFEAPVSEPEPYAEAEPPEPESSPEPEPAVPTPTRPPATPGMLPWDEFDGAYSEWTVVASRIGKLGLKGIHLINTKESSAMLPWKKIRMVSVGRIRSLGSGSPGARDSLVFDLIVPGPNGSCVVYRTTGKAMEFQIIFPGVEQTFFDAYENFIGILLNNSGAKCSPDRERCTGPIFAEYSDLLSYEQRLRNEIEKQGQPA